MKVLHLIKGKTTFYIEKIPESLFILTMVIGIPFSYISLIGLQGFDLGDEGLLLTTYQQLFEHPHSSEYQFLFYNGSIVGAIWNVLFGKMGIYGFRILSAILYSLTVLVAYETLKSQVSRSQFIFSIVVLMLWVYNASQSHHNSLSCLFASLSLMLIHKSLVLQKWLFFFLAGVIVGLNIFTRLPNVSMVAFAFVLIPFYFYSQDSKQTWRFLGIGILGVILGIVLELTFLLVIGHFSIFVESVVSGISVSTGSDSSHNMRNLLSAYILAYKKIISFASIFSLPILIHLLNFTIGGNQTFRRISYYVTSSILWILFLAFLWNICSNKYESIYLLYAFPYVVMLTYFLMHPENESATYLISLSTIMLFLLPSGSDCIANLWVNIVFIAFPLSVNLLFNMIRGNKALRDVVFIAFSCFCIVASICNIVHTSVGCFFDPGCRTTKTERCHHPLTTTFTDGYKCTLMDDLLKRLEKYVEAGDYLLCWPSIPMVHYLTHTYPYLNHPFPTVYDSRYLESQFRRAEKLPLPIVVCNKAKSLDWFTYDVGWNSENEDVNYAISRKNRLFNRFVKVNKYETVWENSVFIIMLPNSPKTQHYE